MFNLIMLIDFAWLAWTDTAWLLRWIVIMLGGFSWSVYDMAITHPVIDSWKWLFWFAEDMAIIWAAITFFRIILWLLRRSSRSI